MNLAGSKATKLSQNAGSVVPITFPSADPHIERRKDRRGYETPCGRLPSVTTIIKETAPQDSKDRLEAWLARPGARQESAAACRRGSWVHQQIENYLAGEEVQNHLAFGGYYRNIIGWIEKNVVEPIAMEKPIFHPAGFSGTFDCLAYCSEWMDPTLIDWKTSKRKRSPTLSKATWINSGPTPWVCCTPMTFSPLRPFWLSLARQVRSLIFGWLMKVNFERERRNFYKESTTTTANWPDLKEPPEPMKGPNQSLAFIQIDMRFKSELPRLFTYTRELNEYELNLILDDLIDEMSGLEYDGPIRVVHQYKSGAKMVTPLVFHAVDE